jgi:hypothetical protein
MYGLDFRQRALRIGIDAITTPTGPIRSRPVLDGLHHVYEHVA